MKMRECWNARMRECWNAGMLECWNTRIKNVRINIVYLSVPSAGLSCGSTIRLRVPLMYLV